VSSNISERLSGQGGRAQRASAGLNDNAPPSYRAEIDAYFKAIASRKAQ